ncbi:peroxisome biogenesis protein 1-like isoform X1 [Papaver somniferum]|uniref:peroxisome biogenesis protein 1-like isoform X1 n=2 Tax=Papaver somniferum TaxID=3469 RepID=UPI000E6FA769|nr:peroxisome biogenesis protein 1-like isoform X1 [Papaver somniferum]
MELDVRVVSGIDSCFVSLPLSLIQTLQSTRSFGSLPPVLSLELRSQHHQDDEQLWHVAWSGSASSSSSIEIAQQMAECISLPDGVKVKVRAAANLPKATLVVIEPYNEDDWEVLELNAEHAELAILKQVGIVHEGMRFPLWMHGHTVLLFHVVSTFPSKSVVQLVPGTEVAVAPKRRKKNIDSHEDVPVQGSEGEESVRMALLRVQDPGRKSFWRSKFNGVDLHIGLTSFVFIHPDTAKKWTFDNLHLVKLLPKVSPKDNLKTVKTSTRKISNSIAEDGKIGVLPEEVSRCVVVRLLLSESVVRGHIMIPLCLRLYLRVGLRSWVYIKECSNITRSNSSLLKLSPCQFKLRESGTTNKKDDMGLIESRRKSRSRSMSSSSNLLTDSGIPDFSIYEELTAVLSRESPKCEVEETKPQSDNVRPQQGLVHAWFSAQLEAIISNTGIDVNSLVLGTETLLHFEVLNSSFRTHVKEQQSIDGSGEGRTRTEEPPIELLYLLANSAESSPNGGPGIYEFSLKDDKNSMDNLNHLELSFAKMDLGDPIYLDSVKEKFFEKNFSSTLSSLSWMQKAASEIIYRLAVLLSPTSGILFNSYTLPLPGHVLIYGPPGSGKTSLVTAVAKSFEEHPDIFAHIVFVSCSSLALEKLPKIQEAISGYISEALDHSPSVVILDDLDSIVSSPSDSEGSQQSSSTIAFIEFLTDLMDEYAEKRQTSCGIGPVGFLACAQSLGNLPQSLSSSGRFDFHVELPAPTVSERGAILKHEIYKRSLQCSEDILLDVASKCDGYDAYDLEILVDRAIHAAVGRFLPSQSAMEEHDRPILIREDFLQAMHDFLPVAMRGVTKSASDGGRTGWDDVGGLVDIRNAIQEMIELPSKFPTIFAQAPLRLRSNVLLYGPPGCGKTHIVGAAAAACSLRFISVKGPELLNKYIGASEQAVRDVFSKAAAAAPCLLFFDEFDSIAPKRGHDNTGVTDRVVNQLLTELDGVEVLTGVFVFAATSRPDLLDAALLRPGRLDRLLFCDFPSRRERMDILTVLSRKLPLAGDVDLDAVASLTEGLSGADLQALLSDAQLASVHELLESDTSSASGSEHHHHPREIPVISNKLLQTVASRARPSVSESEKRRLFSIYNQFLDSKKSVTAQARDAKGKRATLA